MAIGKNQEVGRQLRTLFNVGAIRDLSDGQLLERFATDRGEAAELAFAALVERHGPMVLRVCRGVLDDPHDSQDAFQATFLVLVTKVRKLWVQDSIGPWLYQVAFRTAKCARSTAARRSRLERQAASLSLVEHDPGDKRDPIFDDRDRVLNEEINRLPEHFRAPLILCDLHGQTHEQAARALGWPIGTVKSRQARARDRLRSRLVCRGLAPGAGVLVASTGFGSTLPATWLECTTVAAVRFLASRAIVPGSAALLAREVVQAMTILRWWKAASVLLAMGAAGSGVGLLAQDGKPGPGAGSVPISGSVKPDAQVPAIPDGGQAKVVPVQPGKLAVTFVERGVAEPARYHDVLNTVEGNTVILMIKPEGSMVNKGDIIVELDSSTLRDTLINQRITNQQSETAYKQARLVREVTEYASQEYIDGILPKERATLKGKVDQVQSAIQKAEARLKRTQSSRELMKAAMNQKQTSITPPTPQDIAADLEVDDRLDDAELNLSQQKLDLDRAKSEQVVLEKYTSIKTIKQLAGDSEEARVEELRKLTAWQLEKTREAKLEKQIASCTLKAPDDGLLAYGNDSNRTRLRNGVPMIEEGATVRDRQMLFRVIDVNGPMRINAKIHESLVDRVKPGMSARIKVDGLPDENLTGIVKFVAPMPDANSRLGPAPNVYSTYVQFEKATTGLRSGMTAQVEILVTELDQVISVPTTSVVNLFNIDNKAQAQVKVGVQVGVKTPEGSIEWRDVTLGLTNGTVVEVKSGLRPGDLVVLNPRDQMNDVMKRQAIIGVIKPPSDPNQP